MLSLVSILIPVHNAEPWLAETLECALGQTWSRKEIIVVDDGSTDESLRIARAHEGPNLNVIAQENQGGCAARNRAFEEAQGNFIQYLDADDLMASDKIEVQMERLRREKSETISWAPWHRFHETPGDFMHDPAPTWRDYADPLEWLILSGHGKVMAPLHGWLAPRTVVEHAGPWNENLLVNQDGEYFARILLESEAIAFCPETCVYYRSGLDGSVSRQRSPEVLVSQHRAAMLINENMLRREDSQRVRSACAQRLQAFVQEAYPDVPHLVRRAERQIERLGGAGKAHRQGRSAYQRLSRLIGWKAAKRLRRLYYRFRYGKTV